jgi:hypothetical protein
MSFQNHINNSTNISQVGNEFLFVQMSPGIINTLLLTVGLCQMYVGIEIAHPVYAVLFSNLTVTLLSSLIDVFVFPFITILKYAVLVIGNNVTCFLFHCCSWCVLSFLRFLYIVNPDWLHNKFPNAKTLCILAIFSQFSIFLFSYGIVLGTAMYFGWPYKRAVDLTSQQRLIRIGTILITYFSLVGTSCVFYILILRKRGKLGINNVGTLDQESGLKFEAQESTPVNQKGNTKSKIKPSQMFNTNPISFSNTSTAEDVIPKIILKQRCLSFSDISSFTMEENQNKRSKSNEELNHACNNVDKWNITNTESKEALNGPGKLKL